MGTTHPLAAVVLARALVGDRGAQSRAERPEGARPVPYGAYLAEHYLPGLDERRVELLGRRLRGAAARRGGGAVRLLASAGVPGDDALLTIFWASSPDVVAATVRQAGLPADRIVPVVWHPDGRRHR
jgi:hypothetical protein